MKWENRFDQIFCFIEAAEKELSTCAEVGFGVLCCGGWWMAMRAALCRCVGGVGEAMKQGNFEPFLCSFSYCTPNQISTFIREDEECLQFIPAAGCLTQLKCAERYHGALWSAGHSLRCGSALGPALGERDQQQLAFPPASVAIGAQSSSAGDSGLVIQDCAQSRVFSMDSWFWSGIAVVTTAWIPFSLRHHLQLISTCIYIPKDSTEVPVKLANDVVVEILSCFLLSSPSQPCLVSLAENKGKSCCCVPNRANICEIMKRNKLHPAKNLFSCLHLFAWISFSHIF